MMRKTFVATVLKLMESNKNIVLLLGDIGVHGFREAFLRFPDRVFNIGILEQATVGVAAGWALRGYTPIVHTIAPFLVERAYEQLKIDFGYQKLPGIFVGVGGSYDYASLGCTHHCPADVSLIENIPGFTIYTPGNSVELENALQHACLERNTAYIRLSERENTRPNPLGFSYLDNSAVGPVILSIGPCLDMSMAATMGLNVRHAYLNVITGKELRLMPLLTNTPVVVVEPWYRSGISQCIADDAWPNSVAITNFCIPKTFIKDYGSINEIDKKIGFTADRLRSIVEPLCKTTN